MDPSFLALSQIFSAKYQFIGLLPEFYFTICSVIPSISNNTMFSRPFTGNEGRLYGSGKAGNIGSIVFNLFPLYIFLEKEYAH